MTEEKFIKDFDIVIRVSDGIAYLVKKPAQLNLVIIDEDHIDNEGFCRMYFDTYERTESG